MNAPKRREGGARWLQCSLLEHQKIVCRNEENFIVSVADRYNVHTQADLARALMTIDVLKGGAQGMVASSVLEQQELHSRRLEAHVRQMSSELAEVKNQ